MTRDCGGFTMIEALGAMALTLTVLSAVLLLVQPGLDQVVQVPEAVDLHERGRAAEAVLRRAIEPAGSGTDLLGAGALTDVVPAIWPRRLGRWSADPDGSAWADRFTTLQVPWLAAQAPLAVAAPGNSMSLALAPHVACGTLAGCGFDTGDHVALIEQAGAIGFTRLAGVAPGLLERDVPASAAVDLPASAAVIAMTVVYFDAAKRQLRRYDGLAHDQPVVDDVVWMGVRYYADPLPPRYPALTGHPTCVTDAAGMPLLPLLGPAPAPLVELSLVELSDGPWCGRAPWRFDADLLRVRGVRVAVRLQAAREMVRGSGLDFLHPGAARRPAQQVRDLALDVFVAPRVVAGGGT
jgi:hypothetical protein